MSQYFPKPFRIFGGNINVKVDISNYATKTDLKNVTHVDSSSFAAKTNFVLNDLGKISDVVKHDVAKKKLCVINRLQKYIILILVNLC